MKKYERPFAQKVFFEYKDSVVATDKPITADFYNPDYPTIVLCQLSEGSNCRASYWPDVCEIGILSV